MLDCMETLRNLYPYLDRELTEAEIVEVKRHLEACPPCGRYVHFEASIQRLVRTTATRDCAPERLRSRLEEKLRQGRA